MLKPSEIQLESSNVAVAIEPLGRSTSATEAAFSLQQVRAGRQHVRLRFFLEPLSLDVRSSKVLRLLNTSILGSDAETKPYVSAIRQRRHARRCLKSARRRRSVRRGVRFPLP
ncbi:uncharacterized protein STEHIDRAFT_145559 [Stereum hirsutum FP-91666 SS1]|uniref:uncharacterized protein n=1 Tax=Stereum hirsutum (strain FP-91666) TaxID=721885 RepID=UPI000440BCB7|nr:uncharacterized protein STEHIDRAFT_145559 [Stereum hirsutum FP-91666 SS1]EIM90505.1 hypothetical protein STEHIDRAFT_145559 [Stereum hirsutum FP-91666 SS1]